MSLLEARSTTPAAVSWGPLVLLAACGGGTSTSEIRLMDAPPEGVTAVNLYVAAMQIHVAGKDEAEQGAGDPAEGEEGMNPGMSGDDDGGDWETLSVGRSIDLVQHQGETAADVLGQLELPEGKITQIRLVLDTAQSNTAVKDGVSCELDLSKVNPKGVKITHPFKAFDSKAGSKHTIVVDVELDKSLVPKGSCFELKPVIKLHKVKTDGADIEI